MMKMLFLALFFVFFNNNSVFAATTTLANTSLSANKSPSIPSNWKIYKISDNGWSIQYPRGWGKIAENTLDTLGIIGGIQGPFRRMYMPTIIITQEKLTDTLSLSEYTHAAIKSIKMLPDYTFISQEIISTIDGEYGMHVFTAKLTPDISASQFYQVYIVKGDMGFTFTAATGVTPSKILDTTIRKILSSIHYNNVKMTESK